ncbi:hypothetical protein [Frankia sp. AvcI1]|uniref:hypothetical protein n=1 Tax=Frankia sp. AvcI1 TaxID=573496 RepID=UPI0021193AD3|nr:hypothetical protein [Frankia sp. AvcI1]
MSTATRTASPHRAKALDYLRSGRVRVWWLASAGPNHPASRVHAWIQPAASDPTGTSVPVAVVLEDHRWECAEHPGANSCGHRLAVQLVTGHDELGGGWQA